MNALKQIFKLNEYPIQFIDRCIKQFIRTLYVTKAIQDTVNKKQLLIVFPFLVVQWFLVRKPLQSCIRNHLPYCSLRMPFNPKLDFPVYFALKISYPKR